MIQGCCLSEVSLLRIDWSGGGLCGFGEGGDALDGLRDGLCAFLVEGECMLASCDGGRHHMYSGKG